MKRLLFSTAALLAGVSPALAAPGSTPVEEVVVTATRLPTPIDLSPGVRVIDETEIEARGLVTAKDALDTVPGVSVYDNGTFGGVTSVRMRGATSDKTLVLIDGVPQNDPSQPAGSFDFSSFDLADIKRIEILSGPQGSLWGSDAIGGVISFTTREPDGIRAALEAGSFSTARATVSAGHSEGTYAFGGDISAFSTAGISKADARDGNPETDGFRNHTAGLFGRAEVGPGVRLEARVRWNQAHADIDGFPAPAFTLKDTPETSDSESWTGFVRATVPGPWGLTHQISASAFRIDRSSSGGAFPFAYDADRQVYRWTAERARTDEPWGVAFGVEREAIKAQLSDSTRQDAGSSSAFVVARVSPVQRLSLTGSLRYDDPDHYRGVATGRAAAVFDLGSGFSLNADWGQGFKTPTISETACDFCFPAGPATNLRPEHATGFDLGGRWRSEGGGFSASVTAYRLSVRDQIDFVFNPSTFAFRYANIERTRTNGVEAESSARLGHGLTLKGGWAWTDAIDASTGLRLLRVPERQGSLSLLWTGDKGHGALTVRSESEQADSGGTRKGFVTANFAGGWRLTDHVEATLRIENLADVRYQESLGYGEPGRSAWAGLRLRY